MGRRTKVALVAGGAALAIIGRATRRTRSTSGRPTIPKPTTGLFPNGMAYARWGTGPKTVLVLPGGPANGIPSGPALSWALSPYRPLVAEGHTVWMVARRRNMPRGHAYADMAEDYALLIADEFGGRVDLVIGISTGGQIGFYLAHRHPDSFGHIVILVAGFADSERAKRILIPFATLAGEGRSGEAMALMFELLYPSLPSAVARLLARVMGRVALGETPPFYANDVMVEAEAELACDARDILPGISVPVLLVCGDRDEAFPKETYEETAALIPDCTLRMYAGLGHMGVIGDKRLAPDILDFVRQHEEPPWAGSTELPSAEPQPVGAVGG